MIYELLIVNEEQTGFCAKRGDIADIQPQGHAWSNRERSSRFIIVEQDLSQIELIELSRRQQLTISQEFQNIRAVKDLVETLDKDKIDGDMLYKYDFENNILVKALPEDRPITEEELNKFILAKRTKVSLTQQLNEN